MKADPHTQLVLLDVQAHDAKLARLSHRRGHLPENAAIDELSMRIAELDGQRIEHETQVADLTQDQRKADREVEQVRARKQRDDERLNSGALSNPKDLANLQHEVVALERRIGTLEDEELEIMEALEQAQTVLDKLLGDLETHRAELKEVETTRNAAVAEIDTDASQVVAEREAIVADVPEGLLALYDKLRKQYSGLGAGALRARTCEACRLELNGADIRELAAKPDDEVLRCPECSRILIRTKESGI